MLELALLLYTLIAIGTIRPVAGHFAWAMLRNYKVAYPALGRGRDAPTGDQWFGAYAMAFALAVLWPIAALVMLPSGHVQIGAEKEAALKAREKRVAELEAEFDLS